MLQSKRLTDLAQQNGFDPTLLLRLLRLVKGASLTPASGSWSQ